MEQHAICADCPKRDRCKRPCKEVQRILWSENRVMERHYQDFIVCYPKRGEVHFSELEQRQLDSLSADDMPQFHTNDFRLRKTRVFVDRFFNRIPVSVLAERYGVPENTIVSMYKQSVEQIERLVEVMDARKEGIKAMKPDRFTEDQKWFLLAHVFGFPQAEVARMFGKHKDTVNKKVKRLADRYAGLFDQEEPVTACA